MGNRYKYFENYPGQCAEGEPGIWQGAKHTLQDLSCFFIDLWKWDSSNKPQKHPKQPSIMSKIPHMSCTAAKNAKRVWRCCKDYGNRCSGFVGRMAEVGSGRRFGEIMTKYNTISFADSCQQATHKLLSFPKNECCILIWAFTALGYVTSVT